jgi:hypothetical protein
LEEIEADLKGIEQEIADLMVEVTEGAMHFPSALHLEVTE